MSDSSLYHMIDGAISRAVRGIVTPAPPPAQELQLAIGRFSDVRAATLELACNITAHQASYRPAPKTWTIAEILDHLVLTEDSYRVQLQRLIDLARAGKQSAVNLSLKEMNPSFASIPRDIIPLFEMPLRMMNAFIPHSVREAMIRFPILPATNPNISDPRPRAIADLRQDLVTALAASKALFDGPLPPRLLEMTVTHPILGMNNVVKIFQLMTAHEERHQGQIRAILANPRLPKD